MTTTACGGTGVGGAGAPLASAQRRLWFLHQLAPGSAAYNICTAIELTGRLDLAALRDAVLRLGRRHEVLRATFGVVDDEPRQWFDSPAVAPTLVDLSGVDGGGWSEVERRMREIAARPFDLAAGPPVAWLLFRLTPERHVLVFSVHHIVFDGGSLAVVCAELEAAYRASREGRPDGLPDGIPGYSDLIGLESTLADEDSVDFWRETLRDAPARSAVFGTHRAPAAAPAQLVDRRAVTDWDAFDALCRREGVTHYVTLLAALGCLVARYSGQRDVVLGSPVALRGHEALSSVVGMLTNTLPLRLRLDGDPTFRQVLARARDSVMDALEHQLTPFEEIVDALEVARDPQVSPLFQVLFAYQRRPEAPALPEVASRLVPVPTAAAKYELTVTATEFATGSDTGSGTGSGTGSVSGLELAFEADPGHCGDAELRAFSRHFRTLLDTAVRKPDTPLSALPLLSEVERQRLAPLTRPRERTPAARPVHHLVERVARERPDAIALVCGQEHVSYRELNRRANRLARELRHRGCGQDEIVAVRMRRRPDLVVAILAVLKAGAAYLPIDLAHPVERVRGTLRDAAARLVITEPELRSDLDGTAVPAVLPDDPDLARHSDGDLGVPVAPTALAYVLSTSGSTGRPKGVAIQHDSAVAFLGWVADAFPGDDLAAVLATTSVGFDLSVFELFGPLTTGGSVVLADSALQVPELAAARAATLLNTVPSAAEALLDVDGLPTSLRAVNLAGEPLHRDLVRRIQDRLPGVVARNLYGPSEATTYATATALSTEDDQQPTIGTAISPAAAWVAGEAGEPEPAHVVGELVIGGPTVARGYLGRPGLTAASFRPDPRGGGSRIYRTGDLARRRGDGHLVFLGRTDDQVKVRGVRIELGEVEAVLREIAGVRAAVAVPTGRGAADRQLVGFVTPEPGAAIVPEEVLSTLRTRLPAVMVPTRLTVLEALPLNDNGKIDRGALVRMAELARPQASPPVPPRTTLERLIAEAWREVLGLDQVGVHDGFFEAGGTSLTLLRLHSALSRKVRPAPSLVDLFRFPTIAALAVFLTQRDTAPDAAHNELSARARERGARRRAVAARRPAGEVDA
uniref:TlmIX n=1 Tax=Streptoalloteichus hindustanus TaxID=2017 RepID=A4KUA9_STRHI|nr:TlmIX [Streptoalloteichus hindustanus]